MNKIHTSSAHDAGQAAGLTGQATTVAGATKRDAGVVTSSSVIKRIYSIARAEVLLFVRNPTILMTALLLPVVMVAVLAPSLGAAMEGASFSSFIVQTLAVWALLLIVYVNLTTIFVSRREDGVFQRMSTGEASPWEGMIAASVPSVVVTLVQVALGVAGAMVFADGAVVVNPLLIIVAILGASVFLGGVSAWTSRYTSTVEGAQFSTMPVLMVLLFTSGSLIPVGVFPEALARLDALQQENFALHQRLAASADAVAENEALRSLLGSGRAVGCVTPARVLARTPEPILDLLNPKHSAFSEILGKNQIEKESKNRNKVQQHQPGPDGLGIPPLKKYNHYG